MLSRVIMKIAILLLISFASFNVNAQNTRLVFNDSPVNSSDFDGDHMAFYDARTSTSENSDVLSPYEKFHANGQLAEKGLIVNNKLEGLWRKYNEDGKLIAKIRYNEGVKTGKWIVWSKDGKVLSKGHYNKEGAKTGNWIVWSSIDDEYLKRSY